MCLLADRNAALAALDQIFRCNHGCADACCLCCADLGGLQKLGHGGTEVKVLTGCTDIVLHHVSSKSHVQSEAGFLVQLIQLILHAVFLNVLFIVCNIVGDLEYVCQLAFIVGRALTEGIGGSLDVLGKNLLGRKRGGSTCKVAVFGYGLVALHVLGGLLTGAVTARGRGLRIGIFVTADHHRSDQGDQQNGNDPLACHFHKLYLRIYV